MDVSGIPGFRGELQPGELITAGVFLLAGPIVGWIGYRLLAGRLRHTKTITSWGGQDIVVGALRSVLIVWMSVGGAYAALTILRDEDGRMPINGLRLVVEEPLTKALIAILIGSVTWGIAKATGDAIKLYSLRTQGVSQSSSIFVNMARLVVLLVGLLVLLQSVGVHIGPILAALGVGGLAVALALQDTMANFFAGLQIIATKKVKPGDFVRLEGGLEGYVTDIDWRHTSIRQLANNMVMVPNAKLAGEIVTNFYYPETELSIPVRVGVSYDSDLGRVEDVAIAVAREVLEKVEGGVPTFDPFVRFHTFDDWAITFDVILRAGEFTDQYLLRHQFIKRLHRRFADEGIEIPMPVVAVRLDEDGNGAARTPQRRRAGGDRASWTVVAREPIANAREPIAAPKTVRSRRAPRLRRFDAA